MAYESIGKLKKYMQKKIDAIVTGEKVTFNINAHQLLDEINEIERKAKAFNEIVEYKRNIMAVKEISLTHATDEPFNDDMYAVHSLVDNLLDVINDFEERVDDEN